jgi:hypothetical protein
MTYKRFGRKSEKLQRQMSSWSCGWRNWKRISAKKNPPRTDIGVCRFDCGEAHKCAGVVRITYRSDLCATVELDAQHWRTGWEDVADCWSRWWKRHVAMGWRRVSCTPMTPRRRCWQSDRARPRRSPMELRSHDCPAGDTAAPTVWDRRTDLRQGARLAPRRASGTIEAAARGRGSRQCYRNCLANRILQRRLGMRSRAGIR